MLPPRPWIIGAAAGAVAAGALAAALALAAPPPPDKPSAAFEAAIADARWVPPPTPPSASAAASAAPIEVEVAGPQIDGMDREETIETLHAQDKAIAACGAPSASATEEQSAGGIRVRIEVRADGSVKEVEVVEHEPADERVAECVKKAVRKIRFKRPGAPATVVTAWSFEKGE